MPWFPEFASAAELARMQVRATGQADPVGQYVAALNKGDTHALETVWPGEVVVYDPHHGEIRGRKRLRQFVKDSRSWLAERHARVETVACTVAGDRAVVELLAHLAFDGRELAWPVAVVAESPDDRSVVFRSYFSRRAVDGQRHLRPAILKPGAAHPGDVVGRYQAALAAGDAGAVVRTFAPDGYYREPAGPPSVHRGAGELGSFFTMCFSAGGGIGLQHCTVTDDSVRCALEYTPWNITVSAGAAMTCHRRRGSRPASAARTGCWPRSVSMTTSNRPAGGPERPEVIIAAGQRSCPAGCGPRAGARRHRYCPADNRAFREGRE